MTLTSQIVPHDRSIAFRILMAPMTVVAPLYIPCERHSAFRTDPNRTRYPETGDKMLESQSHYLLS